MSTTLSIVLTVVSALVLVYVILKIRSAKLNIIDSIFWIITAVVLLLLAIFPQIAYFFSTLLGIQTPFNFLILVIIALLLLKIFLLSLHVSRQNEKIKILAQKIAYDEFEKRRQDKNENNSLNKNG